MENNIKDVFNIAVKLKENGIPDRWIVSFRDLSVDAPSRAPFKGIMFRMMDGSMHVFQGDGEWTNPILELNITDVDDMYNVFIAHIDESLYNKTNLILNNKEFRAMLVAGEEIKTSLAKISPHRNKDEHAGFVKLSREILKTVKECTQS